MQYDTQTLLLESTHSIPLTILFNNIYFNNINQIEKKLTAHLTSKL